VINKYFAIGIGAITILKIIAIFLTSYSLFGDEAQYWLWSKNFDFGYFSKPPFIAWIIACYSWFFGESFESLKLLPVTIYFITSLVVFHLCLRLGFERRLSIICSLSFLIMPAVSVSSFFISTDVFLLLFWTLSMVGLLNIKKNPSIINFVLCGIMVGLAFLAKYAAIYFFVSLSCLCLFDKGFRNLFISNFLKLFLLIFVVLIVIFPNLIWNINNDWLTLQHTSENASLGNANINFFRGLNFLVIQVLMVGIILFFGALYNFKKIKLDEENVFLLCFSLPIILIVFFESVLVRANANWAAVGLISLFLFFIRSLFRGLNLFLITNFVVNFVFAIIFYFLVAGSYNHKAFNRINGVGDFSQEIKSYLGQTSNIVISDRLLYSSLAYELKAEKVNFYMPYNSSRKITNHFQITSPLKRGALNNFVLIGDLSDIEYLGPTKNIRLIKETGVKFTKMPIKIYEVSF